MQVVVIERPLFTSMNTTHKKSLHSMTEDGRAAALIFFDPSNRGHKKEGCDMASARRPRAQ